MSLSRQKQETVILFNESEPNATVYTYNGKLKRRLERISQQFPSDIKVTDSDNTGAVTYEIPKRLVSIRQPQTEQQRQAARERALQSNFRPRNRDVNP